MFFFKNVQDLSPPPRSITAAMKRVFLNSEINKWTGRLILSIRPFKDCNARFTTVPLKASSDQMGIRYPCFCLFKLIIFESENQRYLPHFNSD